MKLFLALLVLSSSAFAADRSDEIQSWQEVVAPKGYILSNDLYYEKMCSKIWTKQISEFKTKNPHIKDPNLILINEKIVVQNCKIEELKKNTFFPTAQEIEDNEEYQVLIPYVGVYVGGNYLSGKSGDTEKTGYSLGMKLGYDFALIPDFFYLGLAVGYLENTSTTSEDSSLGKYEIKTKLFNIEAHVNRQVSEKVRAGFLLNLIAGDDVSLSDSNESRNVGVLIGAESLYKLSKSFDLETNVQHRLDDLSRINLMLNLGLRYQF